MNIFTLKKYKKLSQNFADFFKISKIFNYLLLYLIKSIKYLKASPDARKKLIKSFQMMLDFYGMRMKDTRSGEIERTEDYKERYSNLIK